jgi:hypothetical protein
MSARDPHDRTLVARIAASSRWAKEPDRAAATAPARAAFDRRFVRQVDPDGVLDPDELARRVASAKSAFYARLQLKSAQARRERAVARKLTRQQAPNRSGQA